MLRNQMQTQRARELALHYLAAYGEKCSPEVYLLKVKEMEAVFLKALQQPDGKAA